MSSFWLTFYTCDYTLIAPTPPNHLAVLAQTLSTLTMYTEMATYVYVYAPVGVELSTIGPSGAFIYVVAPISPSIVTNATTAASVNINAAVASTVSLNSKSIVSALVSTPGEARGRLVGDLYYYDCGSVKSLNCPPYQSLQVAGDAPISQFSVLKEVPWDIRDQNTGDRRHQNLLSKL